MGWGGVGGGGEREREKEAMQQARKVVMVVMVAIDGEDAASANMQWPVNMHWWSAANMQCMLTEAASSSSCP